jgi:hypothetical protein
MLHRSEYGIVVTPSLSVLRNAVFHLTDKLRRTLDVPWLEGALYRVACEPGVTL